MRVLEGNLLVFFSNLFIRSTDLRLRRHRPLRRRRVPPLPGLQSRNVGYGDDDVRSGPEQRRAGSGAEILTTRRFLTSL